MSTAIAHSPLGRKVTSAVRTQGRVNVGSWERIASLVGGGTLVAFGISRRSPGGLALAALGAALAYRGATGHCHAYQALGMNTARRRRPASIPSGQGVKVEESITVMRPKDEVFAFWRNLSNLPRVMQHLVSVTETGPNRSHWVAQGPTGNVEWDAEIITLRDGELIGWRSLEGSTVATAGSVHFEDAPGNRGTEVRISLSYNPPAGQVGAALAWLSGRDAQTEVRRDLHNFKRMLESGSLPTTAGQPRGSCR